MTFSHLIAATTTAIALSLGAPSTAMAQEGDPLLHLIQSRGTVLSLTIDVASVLVADPSIADVQPISANSLFVFGKAPGATDLILLDEADRIVARRSVYVTRSLQSMSVSASG